MLYRRYAPDRENLEMRPEVNVKVKVTQNGMHNSCHPKRNQHPKFGIPTSNNIGDMHQTQCSF